MANAGFMFDFQLINVTDFNGVGESEPNPYFYQVSSQPWGDIFFYSKPLLLPGELPTFGRICFRVGKVVYKVVTVLLCEFEER